jgi:hypothetical protein
MKHFGMPDEVARAAIRHVRVNTPIPLGSRREISLCVKHPLKRPHLFRRLRNNFLAFLNR